MFSTIKSSIIRIVILTAFISSFMTTGSSALDTDIYATNPRPNVAILFDTSGSMSIGVYDNTYNYKTIYKNACESSEFTAYDFNQSNSGTNNPNYKRYIDETSANYVAMNPNDVVLIKGHAIGVSVTYKDGNPITMTGDTGDYRNTWSFDAIIPTGVKIEDGNWVEISETPLLTLTPNGENQEIYLNNAPLKLDRRINLHNIVPYPDNTTIDKGFIGAMQAPGFHYTGYSTLYTESEDQDTDIWFLASANWVYFMMAHTLYDRYSTPRSGYYTLASRRILIQHSIPLVEATWNNVNLNTPILSHDGYIQDNSSHYYPNNYHGVRGTINQPDAKRIKLHFAALDMRNHYDYLIIKDNNSGEEIDQITEDYRFDFYSNIYNSSNISVIFHSSRRYNDDGFKIDSYQYTTESTDGTTYTMRTRIDVVRDAIKYIIDDTKGTINWALLRFNSGYGAVVEQAFTNPAYTNDDTLIANMKSRLDGFRADGGTPLGESLQDVFKHFHSSDDIFNECSRQFTIIISDGFPSSDTDWSRISGKTFTDADGDGWTADPSQDSTPADNYLDDVAGYIYTHNFRSLGYQQTVSDPEESHNNITTHTLSFAQNLPLLGDTAEDGGGTALSANNSQQMVNALSSLAMLAVQSASYVAPVISVDTANKTQSGEWLYMAFFKPNNDRWIGNLKKYKLAKKDMSFCSDDRKDEWAVTDSTGDVAVDCEGQFLPTSKSFWSNVADGGEVNKGGVGALLKERVKGAFTSGSYYTGADNRNIYVLKNDGTTVAFTPSNMDNFGGSYFGDTNIDDAEKYRIINYIHGYTFAVKDAANGDYDPTGYRNWPLGSIIHSTPKIVDYENAEGGTYLAIGCNDGMLHIFNDSDGKEVVAFIPEDILDDLHYLNPDKGSSDYKESPLFFVDGETSYYYNLNDLDGKSIPKQLIFGLRRGGSSYYSINIENSDPSQWTAKWHINPSCTTTNITGGFPHMGQSWSKMELVHYRTGSENSERSIAGVFGGGYDTEYDNVNTIESSAPSKPGAAFYVIDILESNIANGVKLLKKVVYDSSSSPTEKMIYAIPASPAVIPDKYGFLDNIYISDLGGQIWSLGYSNQSFTFDSAPRLVFQANPGSNSNSGQTTAAALVSTDIGRRMFYSPTVTLMGRCDFINSDDTAWPSDTKVLIVGTGDRENPNRTDINNRIYMILDTEASSDNPTVLNETNLFNVTMDELDIDSVYADKTTVEDDVKTEMQGYLSTTNGWFIKLADINDLDDYGEPVHHEGEKILAHPLVFARAVYVPSFTPIIDDVCNPEGEAKVYALNYCNGAAAINFFKTNDDTSGEKTVAKFDYRDRYISIGKSIPSTPKIIIRDGKAEIYISVGGGLPRIESPSTGKPIDIFNWRELRN